MADNQGFASFSPKVHKEASAKGGKNASNSPKKHKWDKAKAREAALKGNAARKRNAATKARTRLIVVGFDPEQLGSLMLSEDEYIYYGGIKASGAQFKELQLRLGGFDMDPEEE